MERSDGIEALEWQSREGPVRKKRNNGGELDKMGTTATRHLPYLTQSGSAKGGAMHRHGIELPSMKREGVKKSKR